MDNKNKRILEWVILLIFQYVIANSQSTSGEQWFDDPPCNGNTSGECDAVHFDAVCLAYVEEVGGVNTTVTRCTCNNANKFYKLNDSCVFFADVGDTCDNAASICRDVNAVCADDGYGHGVTRCRCDEGSKLISHNGDVICAYALSTLQDTDCIDCVMNHGVCYSLTENGTKDGCHCPTTLSGDDCQLSHVNVTCSIDYMHVCYLPHPGVDMTQAYLRVSNGGQYIGCTAVGREDVCGAGQYYLRLPLSESLRDICRTKRLEFSGTVRYSNDLVVQHDPVFSSPDDIYFGVYCSFRSIHDLNALGISVNSIADSEVGQELSPLLTLSVKTQLGETVSGGMTFRVGDKVFYHLYLDTSEGYAAMRVEFCTLSSSPVIPDSSAETLPVLQNGCPAESQSFLSLQNTWYRVQGQPNEQQTGLVQIIKFRQGDSLNMHCSIKLCIVGSENLCDPMECPSARRRRKREVEREGDSKMVRVHSQLELGGNDSNDDLNAWAIAAVIFSVLLLLIVVIFAIILFRVRPRRTKDPTLIEPPPRDPLETVSANWIAGLRLDDPPSRFTESTI